jgi:hypothetical protein
MSGEGSLKPSGGSDAADEAPQNIAIYCSLNLRPDH